MIPSPTRFSARAERQVLSLWRVFHGRGVELAWQRAKLLGTRAKTPRVAHFMLGAAVGALVAFTALDLQFILGTGGKWVLPEGDFIEYLGAWHYFIGDVWRFPLFEVPAMGYPEGGNVIVSDALPLTALITKVLHSLFGVAVIPFGWWIFLTYVLQGAMAARLVWACGTRSLWASLGAATLALCNIFFMWRLGHTALSSHFLIIWALAVYFESARRGRLRTVEICLLLTLTMMVNLYLFGMVALLAAATVIALWQQKQLRLVDVRTLGVGFLILFAVAIVQGYDILLTRLGSMTAHGLGVYSWNIVTLLVPPEDFWGFPRGVVRDATGGQYEGETYVGLGAVLMLVTAVVISPRALLLHARRHPVLVATLAFLALAAASNKVYAGSRLLLAYNLPGVVESVAGAFRATGRFIWPVAYTLMIVPLAFVFRQLRPALAVPLMAVAIVLQLKEMVPTVQALRDSTSRPTLPDLIDSRRLSTWMTAHRRLWQYPSFFCGGLEGSARIGLGVDANRQELQVQLLAARLNLPTNSFYSSRSFKDCAHEAEWAQQPTFEDGVLYLLGPEAVGEWPALAAATASDLCVNLTWAIACSKSWSQPSPGTGASPEGAVGIEVMQATYGSNCGAGWGNATPDVANACNRTQECDYQVDVRRLGDPAIGCAKQFVVEYRCSGGQPSKRVTVAAEAGLGGIASLGCP
jgi:Family of unknown function (DUF6311)